MSKKEKKTNQKMMSIPFIIVLTLLVLNFVLLLTGWRLKVVHYAEHSDKVNGHVRVALITDLHNCYYGKDMKTLIRAIDAKNPDVILLSGDIFGEKNHDKNSTIFLNEIGSRYDCYYVTGNHEYWALAEAFSNKMDILDEAGITRLSGEGTTIRIEDCDINLYGLDDPDVFMVGELEGYQSGKTFIEELPGINEIAENGNYTIVLSHRPERFDSYMGTDADLTVCGHAHGGQWRIPKILNGFYAPDEGFFPEYAGGRYEEDGKVMIVSRGLARESTPIPRIFNRPEVVIIDID